MSEKKLSKLEIQRRSEALDEAQRAWEDLVSIYAPQSPCPECKGNGSIDAGSLGSICPRCMGRRTIPTPGIPEPKAPPFARLRAPLTAYGNALASETEELPPASSVPTMDDIAAVAQIVEQSARRISSAADAGEAQRELAGPAEHEPRDHDPPPSPLVFVPDED